MQEDSDASIQKTFKPRPYQQQCPSNIVECCKLNDPFDNVECCIVLSTKSKQIEHVQFVSTLSKGRNFTILVRHCCRLWQQSRMLLRQSRTWLRQCCLLLRHCCLCDGALDSSMYERKLTFCSNRQRNDVQRLMSCIKNS